MQKEEKEKAAKAKKAVSYDFDKLLKETMFTYNAERVVGNGSFGVVFQATENETGNKVAIKKVY